MPGIALAPDSHAAWPDLVLPPGFTPAPAERADMLLTAGPEAAPQIDAAERFAAPGGPGRAIVLRLPGAERADWPTTLERTALLGFLRWASLAWAPRGLRLAALSIVTEAPATPPPPAPNQAPSAPATAADIARTLSLIWRVPSLTGQLFRLGPGA